MRLKATNNSVICTPCYEVQTRLSQFACLGEEIETKQFGKVKVDNPSSYTNVAGTNRIAWGVVKSVGRGAAWMKDKYRLDVILQEGDVIGFDASQYTNWDEHGSPLMMLPVDAVLCRFNPGQTRPEALGVYIMTVPDEEAARRFVLGKKAQELGFILTNDAKKGEIRISDNPHSKIRYSAERVVSVGGGGMSIGEGGQQALGDTRAYSTLKVDGAIKSIRTKEPVEIVPDPECVGHVAVFINTMSTDCYLHDTRYRFTNYDRVKALAFDAPAEQ